MSPERLIMLVLAVIVVIALIYFLLGLADAPR